MPRPDRSSQLALDSKPRTNGLLIAAVVLLSIAVIAMFFMNRTGSSKNETTASSTTVSDDGATISPFAKTKMSDDAKTVDIYEDFQCPSCAQAEQTSGAGLRKLATEGKVKVNYHIMNFLDEKLGNNSSTRAANAAMCANTEGKFMDLHDTIYANQPKQEGTGYTDEQLRNWGKRAGLADSYIQCMSAMTHKNEIEHSNTEAIKNGATKTPTFKIDGKIMNDEDKADIQSGKKTWASILSL